jgi:hypothetical protein
MKTPKKEVKLSAKEHSQTVELHKAVTKNLNELADIVGRSLGEDLSGATEFSVTRSPESGVDARRATVITIKGGGGCGVYRDPPGVCEPCCW